MNDSTKKPMDILKGLLPDKMLADDLELIRDKLTGIVNKFYFRFPMKYDEYGGGARILDADGGLIADFENHLNAETFMELIDEIRS